jgi:hypothetical protein
MSTASHPTTAEQAHAAIAASAEQATPEVRHLPTMAVGEFVRQGDVYLIRIASLPPGFDRETKDRQLAPGTTQGSRHVLRDSAGLALRTRAAQAISSTLRAWLAKQPAIGRERAERMIPAQIGPAITSPERLLLEHPEHAHKDLPAGDYLCLYQLDFAEQRAVRD